MSAAQQSLELALAAASIAETVGHLCDAWRALPATRVAKLARGFAALEAMDSLPGANQDEREAAWLALAARTDGSVSELQALLATPWSKKPKDASRRLDHLRRLGPNPLTVGALLDLDTGERYPSAAGNRFWAEVYEVLLSWGSVEAAERVPRAPPDSPFGAARFFCLFEPLTVRWAGRWPREPALTPALTALLERLEARLAPRRELLAGLFAAVYAAPDDDSPRLVLADALTEQGDPRGEFLSLQFADAAGELTLGRRERMDRLLAAAGPAWFDGLEREVAPTAIFERGFLSEVRLATRTPSPALPAWRTVNVIDAAGLALSLSSFLEHPNLARVHSLRTLSGPSLKELARAGAARRWRLLEIEGPGGRELVEPRWTVERLRVAGFVDQSVWWLQGTPLLSKAAVLEFPLMQGFARVGPAVKALAPHTRAALEFTARPSPWPARWAGDWTLRVADGALWLCVDSLVGLEDALRSFEPGQVREVQLEFASKKSAAWRERARELVATAVRVA